MSADGKFVPDPSWPTIVDLAIECWGQPNKALSSKDDVRFGDRGSKSVKPSAFIWKDHESGEGGGYVEMWRLARHGAPLPKRTNGVTGKVKPWDNVGTIYHYHDAGGALVLDVIRTLTGTPRFVQRAPDGFRANGDAKWKWSVKHIPYHDSLLYRLPGLRASGDATVWICEGEKDVDNLHNELLIATCNIGGAGKWRAEYAEEFRGKHCVVLRDNDQAGRDHTATVARSLIGVASSIKVLLLPGLPDKGDVSDWLDAGGTVEDLERIAREAEEFTSSDADEPPPGDAQLIQAPFGPITAIPPRPWAYGHFLMFGVASVIGAMDGAGKGMLAAVKAICMITGKELLGEKVWRTGPVVIISYEDDIDEWCRRIAAVCLLHKLDYETVIKSFYFLAKPKGRVTLAERTKDGIEFPDTPRIVHFLKQIGAVLLIVDPFNNAHTMEDGNNNVAIAAVAQEVSTIAREANVAALVLHHLRKGAVGNIDDLMGAVALRANFRSCRILQIATLDDADALGFPAADAWRYLSIVGTKENYAPPLLDRVWYHKASEKLDNPAGIYTLGDDVGAIERWQPPPLFEGFDYPKMRAVFDAIAAKPHSPDKRTKDIPWVGQPLVKLGDRTMAQAGVIIAQWLKSATLIDGPLFKTAANNKIKTVTVDASKVDAILAGRAPLGQAREPADD